MKSKTKSDPAIETHGGGTGVSGPRDYRRRFHNIPLHDAHLLGYVHYRTYRMVKIQTVNGPMWFRLKRWPRLLPQLS